MTSIYIKEKAENKVRKFFQLVYFWMALGLLVSGISAIYVATSPALLEKIFNSGFFLGLVIIELVLVIILSWMIKRISSTTAKILFVAYSLVTGLTLSVIFLAYTLGSVASIFFVSAGIFALISIYGFFTDDDLTSLGQLFIVGLIGIIISMLINMFLQSPAFDYIISIIGVIIFIGLTAYDTQKLKSMVTIGRETTEDYSKKAIIGALTLYLDLINLFLNLLSLFGKRRD